MAFSNVSDFIITGFPGLHPNYYGLVAGLFFVLYLLIATGNIFILIFVAFERSLHKPTYLIFCNLAVSDLALSTTTVPKIISKFWFDDRTISFYACFLQMFFVHFLGSFNSFVLGVMALDRFIAICNPLRYPALITNTTTVVLCALSWLITMSLMIAVVVPAISLPYCRSNIINHCYCDHISITRLACERVREVQVFAFGVAMFVLLAPLAFIIFSYTAIITSVRKISTFKQRHKVWSTCSPQLFIICLYYLPRCFVYLANNLAFDISTDVRILIILLYTVFPPAVNPGIYCFRTQEIKTLLKKRIKSMQGQ
ncbi:olfactory receptor 2AT4-like [Denticeps clupeoides]|uniref:olfactory receptor 2AT4-like n=1 Tax=Denticeps clupeoides TaxID=299321 RepID=UPI0010A431BD|nr:olfactory receptor 2AT4-like [Denticeps clupeoides]